MALTQPFINSIPAFDAFGESGTNIVLAVLGGDAITGYTYTVYNNGVVVASGTKSVSGDIASETVRNFTLNIPANALLNNLDYTIEVYTSNSGGDSSVSNPQFFTCYVSPSFSFNYYNSTEYVPLTSSYVVSSISLQAQVVFNTNDVYSSAVLKKVNFYLYGIDSDGNRNSIFSGDTLFVAPLNQTIEGFVPTQDSEGTPLEDSPYISYTIVAVGETVDGMQFEDEIEDLQCYYSTSSVGDILTVTNNCDTGLVNIKTQIDDFISKTWTGLTDFYGKYVWTDGTNYYYSYFTSQYVLDTETSTWSVKTWTGLTSLVGIWVWSDGINIYYSYGSTQKVLDIATSTWSNKTWTGLTTFESKYVWTDGTNYYCSYGSTQKVLDISTSTWSAKTWTGLTTFDGEYVWSDGTNIYYSGGGVQKVLNISTSTWSNKTWTGLTNFESKDVWTDGTNYYCSSGSTQKVLDIATSTWSAKTWTGLTTFDGEYVWSDGTNYYYSYDENQYELIFTESFSLFNLQYKLSSDSTWNTLVSELNPEEGTLDWINFNFDFSYCGNGQPYDFRFILYNNDGSIFNSYKSQILSQFKNSYICDYSKIYDITNEWSAGSQSTKNSTILYEPYTTKYPTMIKNSVLKYRSGQYTAILLATTSVSKTSNYIDRMAQTRLIAEFEDWLSNGEAKIIKDFNGKLMIVVVNGDISNSYYKELGNGLASSTFNWVEVGEFTQDYLNKLGLLNNFTLNYT